jgi:hypothetical protein
MGLSLRNPKKRKRLQNGLQGVAVPAFWRHQVLNGLLVGEKAQAMESELTLAFIEDLNRLPVDVDQNATSMIVFGTIQSLCRKHGLRHMTLPS